MRIAKSKRLKKEDVLNIISQYKSGEKITDISEKYIIGQMTVNGIICYYNERNNTVSKKLSKYYKEIVDSIRDERQENIQEYEAKLFFGLITIKIKPVN